VRSRSSSWRNNPYFPDEIHKLYSLKYVPGIDGLGTDNTGSGANAKTKLVFGDYFLDNIVPEHFARRVLQLKHELIHCDQYRKGYTGDNYAVWREYQAYFHSGTASELPGTGKMNASMRLTLIDASLGCFNCLSEATRNSDSYKKNREYLLERRKYYYDRIKDPANRRPPPSGCNCRTGH
jgi:hypothetical protein